VQTEGVRNLRQAEAGCFGKIIHICIVREGITNFRGNLIITHLKSKEFMKALMAKMIRLGRLTNNSSNSNKA
jgi:hypothetical protein